MTREARARRGTASRGNRFVIWPVLAVVGAAWIYLLICKWPGELGLVLAFAMILTWPLGLIALAIIPLVSALRRRWYEAGSWLVGALIVFALWRPMIDSCDYAHLLIMLPFYSAKVAAAPNDHGRELVVDDWSVGLAFTPSIFLIYDDSGRIIRPISRQAPPLTNLGGLETDCSGQAQPLMLHYYLCDVD